MSKRDIFKDVIHDTGLTLGLSDMAVEYAIRSYYMLMTDIIRSDSDKNMRVPGFGIFYKKTKYRDGYKKKV